MNINHIKIAQFVKGRNFMKYTNEELEILKKLYEKIGTFSGVANFIKEKSGISISDATIKYKLEDKFLREGKNFESWINKYNKYTPKYSDEDLELWKQLYEQIGSFLGVSNYLEKNCGIKVYDSLISRKLKKKFKQEGKNFQKWIQKYDKSILRSGFKEVYDDKEIKEWMKLFEKIGSYKGVVRYLKNKYGNAPIDATIKRKIKESFDRVGKNFEDWEIFFSQYSLGLSSGYPEKDVENWEELYKKIGSFQGVSEHIKSVKDRAPAGITIKRRLEQKFSEEDRDFEEWKTEYEDWHFKIYSEEDVKLWENLFERIGSFYGVDKFLKKKYGQGPDSYTIQVRIKQKFERENRDFDKWRRIYGQAYFEEICRWYFEQIFQSKFPKIKLKWLKNPKSGYYLYFDGYNKRLKIAFEYNGPQHYEFTPPYHKSYEDLVDQQYRDALKEKLCKEMEVLLIIVPYWIEPENMQKFIITNYENLTGVKLPKMPNFDYKQFYFSGGLENFL